MVNKQFFCSWCGKKFKLDKEDYNEIFTCKSCNKKNKIWRGIRAIKWYENPPSFNSGWRTKIGTD